MRGSLIFGSCASLALGAGLVLGMLSSSCDNTGTAGSGGSTGTATGGAGGSAPLDEKPIPGELCNDATLDPTLVQVRVIPPKIYLPSCPEGSKTCTTRTVRVIVDPDVCKRSPVTFEVAPDQQQIVKTPAAEDIWLHHNELPVTIVAGAKPGSAKIKVTASVKPTDETKANAKKNGLPEPQPVNAVAEIAVEVIEPVVEACNAPNKVGMVKADDTPVALGAASIRLPKGADAPTSNSFLWRVDPFDATLSCAADMAMPGHVALGPAVTFGPADKVFPRDVPMSIPMNPALMPTAARMRHLVVAYSGPGFKAPRAIPVANPHVEQVNGSWALTFMAPRLGTYQAFVRSDAGTKTKKRRLTYRGVTGVSMGGGGTATFGLRHHDLFDAMAPLGGPVDWTWLLDYIEKNHLGGFRPIPKGTTLPDIQLASAACTTQADCKADESCVGPLGLPPGKCVLRPVASEPYLHTQTFNTWWYEYPRAGNGGSFDRHDYAQIFRDLALMYGNPNGENLAENGENLPAGVPPDHPSVVGDHPNRECAVWVDPLDGHPDKQKQEEIHQNCPKERCAHTLTLQNYFDDEYNPDGIFPVITVCDGTPQDETLTPYSNTWKPGPNDYPLEVGLAVDYNGNGVRDELEPIIRAGHEPWRDTGLDGKMSVDEPGYSKGINDDPAGDDYDPQYNPAGSEGDHRWSPGEPYDDVGLDGVAQTPQQPAGGWKKPGDGYDVGENDGKFTVSTGLQRFWDRDAHSIIRRMVDPKQVPAGDLSDDALSRIDLWTDGGLRDLFNFGVDAQHLVGAMAARGRAVTYLSTFTQAPGLDPSVETSYDPKLVDFDDLPGVVLQRYGHIDPSPTDVENGSGQHVGTASEVTSRLMSAFYFIGNRWKHRPELKMLVDTDHENWIPDCKEASSTITFPEKGQPLGLSGRRGPVGISLPPGYCHKDLQHIRYPVVYLLHGYGQGPEDLEATIVLLRNWTNDPQLSAARRLAKAIVVYVDGRCRTNEDGSAECIRGTFFADSPRQKGAKDDQWWLELMSHLDKNYRTLPNESVDYTE